MGEAANHILIYCEMARELLVMTFVMLGSHVCSLVMWLTLGKNWDEKKEYATFELFVLDVDYLRKVELNIL